MSRGGGFRGRGRGRGGGGGAPAFGARDSLELTKGPLPYSGMLYPPLDPSQVATLSNPTDFEEIIMQKTMELDEVFRKGLPGSQIADGATPWRLRETRKVVGIEIETWADRQKPQASQAGPSTLDPSALYMDESFFPPGLWREHVEGPKDAVAGSGAAKSGKRKRRVLSDDEDDKPDVDGDKSDAASTAEEDFDFEDDDSEHQDYEANYFDNGEGEDDESGGGSDEGGYDND